MGTEYFFACIGCNKIYDLDKQHNALRFLPFLFNEHRDHFYICNSEHYIDQDYGSGDYTVSLEQSSTDFPHACCVKHTLQNPEMIDCFNKEFQEKFKEWQEYQEKKQRRREERMANPKPIPENWWQIEVEADEIME